MRFFKYLFAFFAAIVALDVQADYWKYQTYTSSSAMSLCTSLVSLTQFPSGTSFSHADIYINPATPHNATCYHYNKTNTITQLYTLTLVKEACPTGQQKDFKWWVDLPLPSSVCLNKCDYVKTSTPQSCVDVDIEGFSGIGECGPVESTGKQCDQPDPDPTKQPKPPLTPDECKNSTGSDSYCDKPPDRGCPSGYKQAMFNNKQICVKDSPDDPNPNDPNNGPDDPDDPDGPDNPPNPNGCSNGDPYCDKPPDNSCPTGYYQTIYQGKDICVKNNPNNNGPNPNDPNNPPPDGNEDGDNGSGDGDSEFCEGSGKDICEAITKIKDFLTDEHDLPADEYPEIQEHDLGNYESNYVTWSAQCPPDQNVHINLMGQSSTLVLSWEPWCTLLSKLRWAIIACAYFAAAYIILGMR